MTYGFFLQNILSGGQMNDSNSRNIMKKKIKECLIKDLRMSDSRTRLLFFCLFIS
jgi:hypothetical protein